MNRRKHLFSSLLVIAALALGGGCKQDEPKDEGPGKKEPAAETPELASALGTYEQIRAKLAEDEVAVAEDAAALEKAATAAASGAPEGQKKALEEIAARAAQLGEVGDDPAAVRKAFGEVSRSVVALLSSDEKLAQGMHLFECPMAKGYEKWVQPSDAISNPYMGTSMPKCGSEIEWE